MAGELKAGGPRVDGGIREAMVLKSNFILYVKDQNRSRDFYRSVLQLQPSLDVPGMTEFQLSQLSVLGLMPESGIKNILGEKLPDPSAASGVPRSELYFCVEDPGAYHQRAIDLGALELSKLEKRNWGDLAAYCMDFDGHVLAFASTNS